MNTSQMNQTPASRGSQPTGRAAGMELSSFDRYTGLSATLAGLTGLLYSIAFVIIARFAPVLGGLLSALFLLLGGFFASAALTGIYRRLVAAQGVDPSLALWAYLLGLGGALGSLLHGGYDLSNALHPPATVLADLPNPVDPRGLLTFGLAGAGLLILAVLMGRSPSFSRNLSRLGLVLGILLVLIYLARLIILDAANPLVLVPAALTGFLVNPAFYIWLGRALSRP